MKNGDFALLNLNVTEKSLEELTDIMTKAKEIAIAQSSDFFNADVRKNVANEVHQLYNQSLAIANKKVGLKHIFSGYDTLKVPFDGNGKYQGDQGHISLEVSRDFFVPINLTGEEVFFSDNNSGRMDNPLDKIKGLEQDIDKAKDLEKDIEKGSIGKAFRDLASIENGSPVDEFKTRDNIFAQLNGLASALEGNDPKMIQGLLEKFDNTITRLVTLRTRVGSITNSVESSRSVIEKENIDHTARRSSLIDADVLELFSDINKQQAILKTTYQSSQGLMNQTLMDFLHR